MEILQRRKQETASVSYKKNYTKTGKEIKPVVEVKYDGKLLKGNVDYTVEYNNNINAGEGNIWISGIGEYEGIKVYNFTITEKVNNNSSQKKVKVTSIRLSGISKQIAAGKKITLKAAILPTNASNKKLLWKSSNKKYATVNTKGIVTTKKSARGKIVKTTVMATDGSGKKSTVKIKIKK